MSGVQKLDEIYRDATFSAETYAQLRATVVMIDTGMQPGPEQAQALRDICDRWAANDATEIRIPDVPPLDDIDMECMECGTRFGREPGPRLCGPCWIRFGKPLVWPPLELKDMP